MPLYTENIPWPPEEHHPAYAAMSEWSAWYSGDPATLAQSYGQVPDIERPRRWMFWTRKGEEPGVESQRTKIHVPVASDLAQLSADLLFSEPPVLSVDDATGAAWLEDLIEATGLHNRLLEGAEIAAAMGGVYLRPTWDTDVSPDPILTLVHPDQAAPEWRFGLLRAVTFWRVLSDDDDRRVLRWLERHEPGRIFHGLYEGTRDRLGDLRDLDTHPETAGLEEEIDTGLDGLAVRYVPNMRPGRRLRKTDHGRSDYDGSEGVMDALDETYSSWMRDIRLGKSRLIASMDVLDRRGAGRGAAFDIDQELFTPLDLPPNDSKASLVDQVQFKIRFEEHAKTAENLVERVVTAAGYSPQSFGLHIEGRAESGTALRVRERRSFMTQAKKQRYWKPAIVDVVTILAHFAKTKLAARSVPDLDEINFEWADSVAPDMREVAETIELLARAEAASTETMVRMQHPDWTEDEIAAEVALIADARPKPLPNPFDLGDEQIPSEDDEPQDDDGDPEPTE